MLLTMQPHQQACMVVHGYTNTLGRLKGFYGLHLSEAEIVARKLD